MGFKSALGLKKSQPHKIPTKFSCCPKYIVLYKQSSIYALQHFYLKKKELKSNLITQWKSIIHAYKCVAFETVSNSIQRSWKTHSSITKCNNNDSMI